MHHEWGDGFDFDTLYKAECWINKFYRRVTGLQAHTKEKYGTLRLEYENLWLKNRKHCLIFCEIIYRAIHKFPKVGAEICYDATALLIDKGKIKEYIRYFEGVCWGQCQSEWVSYPFKRGGFYR